MSQSEDIRDFANSLSCIQEETEGPENESPSSQEGSSQAASNRGKIPMEPLDEKLFRLQNRVISMLETQGTQKKSGEGGQAQRPKRKPVRSATECPKRPDVQEEEKEECTTRSLKNGSTRREEKPQEVNSIQDWRQLPGGAVEYRKNLARHYKQQLELLEYEEKELQYQMSVRQQLRLQLHEEEQQCERAQLREMELKEQQSSQFKGEQWNEHLVEENRQLDNLRRHLEEELRISEERRLHLERENQMLLQRPKRDALHARSKKEQESRGPAGRPQPAAAAAAAAASSYKALQPASLRTKSPRSGTQNPNVFAVWVNSNLPKREAA